MAYNYLISISDFAEIRNISTNVNDATRLKQFIKEAQELDIKPVFGEEMYYDLMKNSSQTKYSELLAGKDYTYNNYNYSFIGLKTIIVYYAWARFIENDNIKSTPTGFVTKTNEFSDPIPYKSIAQQADQARSAAYAYIQDMNMFLSRNNTTYTLFGVGQPNQIQKRARFTTISKD